MTSEEDFIEIPNTDLFDQWFSYPDEEQLREMEKLKEKSYLWNELIEL